MNAMQRYIDAINELSGSEQQCILRASCMPISCSADAFSIFTALFWPLQKELRIKREVAWLIMKLQIKCRVENKSGEDFVSAWRLAALLDKQDMKKIERDLDSLLNTSFALIEPMLTRALQIIKNTNLRFDWARLADDLGAWQNESVRIRWAEQFTRRREKK